MTTRRKFFQVLAGTASAIPALFLVKKRAENKQPIQPAVLSRPQVRDQRKPGHYNPTAFDIVQHAMLLAGVLAVGHSMSSEELETGIYELRMILRTWEGPEIEYIFDRVPIAPHWLAAVHYELAATFCLLYETRLSHELCARANHAKMQAVNRDCRLTAV